MRRLLTLLALSVLVLLSCNTVPSEIDPDLTQAELIQRAQEAADEENFDAAIAYYQTVLDRFPDDLDAVATARYEIAFVHYKRGEMDTARAGFTELLEFYDSTDVAIMEWPRVLATTLLEEMESDE